MPDKKADYIAKINKIPVASFNKEQKQIASNIIEKADSADLDAVYGLITQRVKTGFVFDAAPEVNHDCVALIQENKELNINVNELNCTEHKLIIGENYDALKNLCTTYIDKNGNGLIDIIYIDPPYNTETSKEEGNDYKEEVPASKFIYRDKFTRDGWLNMMNERLKLAHRLLSDKGAIFISIDDSEQAYLKVLCDEIFGENCFVTSIPRLTGSQRSGQEKYMNVSHDYILCYAKSDVFKKITERNINKSIYTDSIGDFIKGDTKAILAAASQGYSKGGDYDFEYNGKIYKPIDSNGNRNRWLWTKARMEAAANLGILVETNNSLRMQVYLNKKFDEKTNKMVEKESNLIFHTADFMKKEMFTNPTGTMELENILTKKKAFDNPKPVELIKKLISFVPPNQNFIVLDFFAGSGTTGQAVMELNAEDDENRKFILCTNNENNIAKEITYERLFRIINGKGSKNEKIKWEYKTDKPTLSGNSVRVFNIKHYPLTLKDLKKAEELTKIAKNEFVKLNTDYKHKDIFDIYNDLSTLNPEKDAK